MSVFRTNPRAGLGGLLVRAVSLGLSAVLAGAAMAVTAGVTVAAQADDGLSADAIAAKIIRTDTFSWEGARTRVRMVLIDAGGSKQERAMDVTGRRAKGLYQTLVRFSAPEDIAGTAFLMLERGKDESEQYVYLPGLKRTRRIVGREKEGSFMGSDFSYADMQRIDPRFAKHKRLPDEKLGEEAVYVIESALSTDAPTSYGKVTTWIRKTDNIALRTKFFDRSDKLVKTLYSRRVKEVDGKPVVVEARMQNQQNNHVTELYIDAIERKDDLSDANFTPAALEHL
ncbi:MAG: outer membrane lipoprotein-sorting protein [Polyangiales bacterium]